jgi:hypothetical protein
LLKVVWEDAKGCDQGLGPIVFHTPNLSLPRLIIGPLYCFAEYLK